MDRSTLVTSLLFILTIYCGDFSKAQIISTNEKIQWVHFSRFNFKDHEDAGWQEPDVHMWISRKNHGNGHVIGKIESHYMSAHIIIDGKGVDVGKDVEVLQYPRGSVSWEPMRDINHPPFNLIIGGIDPVTSEPIYICRGIDTKRTDKRRTVCPGMFKFSKSNEGCEINHVGTGLFVKDFEILTLSYYGIAIMAAND